jgi:hypothetical protein
MGFGEQGVDRKLFGREREKVRARGREGNKCLMKRT